MLSNALTFSPFTHFPLSLLKTVVHQFGTPVTVKMTGNVTRLYLTFL